MKTHCRCRCCGTRRVLRKHPGEYLRRQPKCSNCGGNNWRQDAYRHRVELPLIRTKRGRYAPCYCDAYHHPHRVNSALCKFVKPGEYKQ